MDIHEAHSKYTDAYIDILNSYNAQIKESVQRKNELKDKFYNTIKSIMLILTWLFFGILIFSLILFCVMVFNNNDSVVVITGAITTTISSFITMILSIFKLPEIIANYLFNKEEDQLMNEIIKNIQVYELDAVKYEIETIKLEKKGHEDAVIDIGGGGNDEDLTDSSYETPPQPLDNTNVSGT